MKVEREFGIQASWERTQHIGHTSSGPTPPVTVSPVVRLETAGAASWVGLSAALGAACPNLGWDRRALGSESCACHLAAGGPLCRSPSGTEGKVDKHPRRALGGLRGAGGTSGRAARSSELGPQVQPSGSARLGRLPLGRQA